MRIKPYIGITGITSMEEVEYILSIFSKLNLDLSSNTIPMLGYVISDTKSNLGLENNKRYIQVEELINLILPVTLGKVLNMVHYTPNKKIFDLDIFKLIFKEILERRICLAFKINASIFNPLDIIALKKDYPQLSLCFQLPKEKYSMPYSELFNYLSHFGNALDYLFLDPRMENASSLYGQLSNDFPKIMLGMAGGTGPDKMDYVVPPIREILSNKSICIDVEQGLRDKEDNLLLENIEVYLKKAIQLLGVNLQEIFYCGNDNLEIIGSKAYNLFKLKEIKYNVPNFIIFTGVLSSDKLNNLALKYPVAVRSTFPDEDSLKNSHAGQYKSVLNVTPENLCSAIEKCRASYGEKSDNLPVIIQEMIQPDYSGVCFSINPTTGERNKVVIELVNGLSDKLLNGELSGEHYDLEFEDQKVIPSKDFGEYGNLEEISFIAKDLESKFGYPIDMEFAVKNGKVYLLQVRPITGSIPPEFNLGDVGSFFIKLILKWNNIHVGRDAMSPLACSLVSLCDEKGARTRQIVINGYHYLGDDPQAIYSGNISSEGWYSQEEKKWLNFLNQLREKDLEKLSDQELTSELVERLNTYISFFYIAFNGWKPFPQEVAGKLKEIISQVGLKEISSYEDLIQILSICLPSKTRLRDEEMLRLKDKEYFTLNFKKFLFDYGDLLLHNFDISKPTFGENITDVEKSISIHDEGYDGLFDAQMKQKEKLLGSFIGLSKNPEETKKLIKILELWQLRREDDDYYLLCFGGQLRRICLEIGKRVNINEDIFYLNFDTLKTIFNLEPKNILEKIEAGKVDYARWSKMNPPNKITYGKLDYGGSYSSQEKGTYCGLPVCAGYVEGAARVILNNSDLSNVDKGDILVCPTFMPSMNYVIPRLKGLVTQYGIMNSHGAIIAREYNIPSVFNVENITQLIREGQKISIDGSKGVVKVLS